ncbi:FkbM family methyltransferase [Synechococcus sp. CS-1325]|uniref:FkbM family methyltransferase n=1 Tax=unclassified Synechococcus TaxID=2626047 RepID=UPI0021A75ED6|nr:MULTISPECIES: FkbM family methyltransferase [unclassified Synechococcus]MCT0200804.1 FkbM family methyltransferase [Synechococcus sp. CS-1325]MCT0213843.1 FkbM family methyltransferase [Synechococcus sp. CS-1326]MCT0233419.1 FkbM family methyltransferase [Synechococcus sp. CS-1327]
MKHPLLSLFHYWQRHPLASKDMQGTVSRFLRWQISTRMLRMPVVFSWVGETVLVIEKGMTGATMNVYCGLHEAIDMAFVLHFLRPGDVFFDIGANVGTYTILASGVIQAYTIALEPIPATFARLERNLRLNDLYSRVDARCLAVGAEAGSLRFTSSRDTTNKAVSLLTAATDEPTLEVPVAVVDELLSHHSPPILWKVDVEGFEPEVLRGATSALRNPELKAVLLEADTPSLQRTMHDAGFSRFNYDLFDRSLEPASANSMPQESHNQLWIRDLAFVQDRCSTAPRVRIGNITL